MNAEIEIRPLRPEDAEACDAIIRSLPYHFGNLDGRRACAAAVRSSDGLVAVLNGEVVGFLTIERQFDTAAEITWMAVRADLRGQGIGRRLVQHLVSSLRAEGRKLLLVMTLGPSEEEPGIADGYERTRTFYRSLGFIPAREWPDFWPGNPALLLVMPLEPD